MKTINELLNDRSTRKKPYQWHLPNVDTKQFLHNDLRVQFGCYLWLQEYDKIARWLQNNAGKGLMLIGGCGVGKTAILCGSVYKFLRDYLHIRPIIVRAEDLSNHEQLQDVKGYRFVIVDDVGTEKQVNNYGLHYEAFEELVSAMYYNSATLIFSTNLTTQRIEQRYGYRVSDRLQQMCRKVVIVHESLRNA